MRLFILARHGQSLFNVDRVVNGDPARDRGLTEQGIEEAKRLGGEIAALPVDLAAVSPFPRAQQTAQLALGARDVPHLVDDDLGDVRIGELEGKTLDEYRAAPAHANRKERFPGGESLDEAALRYAGCVRTAPRARRDGRRSSSATRSRSATPSTPPAAATTSTRRSARFRTPRRTSSTTRRSRALLRRCARWHGSVAV